ncbi:hypothetical protein [Thalassovita sp.]|uniref:hypothetical protein n=1 Tax=Thalassovita sp. TaxID=1979401 RepID=UPI002B27600B|nr:hypothetical protein [Thalassovita sp.]
MKSTPVLSAFILFGFATQAISQNSLAPLPDLTVDNIGDQLQRCSAFYAATRSVIAEALVFTDDPLEMARLQDLRTRAEDNSDGLLKTAVIFLTVQEGKTDAEAVNVAVDNRDGYAALYLRTLAETGNNLSTIVHNDLWANDMASCAALVANIGSVLEGISKK